MADSDSDVEIGPEKSAEELLRERELAAERAGEVLEVDDDAAEASCPAAESKPKVERKPEVKRAWLAPRPALEYEAEASGASASVPAAPAAAPPWLGRGGGGGTKKAKKAPDLLAAALKQLSIGAAARRTAALRAKGVKLERKVEPSSPSPFAAFEFKAEALSQEAAVPPPAVEEGAAPRRLCDVPCDVDAARALSHRYLHGVRVAFPFAEPLAPQQLVMQRVVKAILHREAALLESPTGTGKTQALLSAALATQRHLQLAGEKVGKIIFATRTIGQVRQLPGELRKNPYRATSVPLASRVHYCTNDALVDDQNAASSARLSQTCRRRGGEKRGDATSLQRVSSGRTRSRGRLHRSRDARSSKRESHIDRETDRASKGGHASPSRGAGRKLAKKVEKFRGGGDFVWSDDDPHASRQSTVGCAHYRALAVDGLAADLAAIATPPDAPGTCGCSKDAAKRKVTDVEDLGGVVNIEDLRRFARGSPSEGRARGCAYYAARARVAAPHEGDSASLQHGCSGRARPRAPIHRSRTLREMIVRPKHRVENDRERRIKERGTAHRASRGPGSRATRTSSSAPTTT